MPIPQVNDRIKEAPVVVLRAVFAGIGQLLLTADKVRARAAEQVWTPDQPALARPSPSWPAGITKTAPATKAAATTKPAPAVKAAATTKPAPAAKSAAPTKPASTTKPASPAKAAPAAEGAPAAKPATPVSPAKPAAAAKAAPAPKPGPAKAAARGDEATPPAVEPPLPGYDDLSLPSLRARLRPLDASAITAMLAYEKAHARRDDVITMLERRLAKITAE